MTDEAANRIAYLEGQLDLARTELAAERKKAGEWFTAYCDLAKLLQEVGHFTPQCPHIIMVYPADKGAK